MKRNFSFAPSQIFSYIYPIKKYIAISLLSIYLVSATELYQLLKLPILLEHYAEHKAENNEMSFLDFLSLHYNQAFDHDNTDSKLPYKSHDCNNAVSFVAFIAQYPVISISKPIFYRVKQKSIYKPSYFSLSIINTIWQPPKSY